MGSLQAVQSGVALERTKVFALSDVTKFPLLQIQYIGKALFSTVVIDAATGDFTIAADDIDGETTNILTIDTDAAAYDTMGEVVDRINQGHADLRAFLIGTSRDIASDNKFDTLAAASIRTTNGLTLFADEAAAPLDQGFAITNNKFTYRPSGGWNTKISGWVTDENVVNMLNYITLNIGVNTGSGNLEIYSCDDINKVNAPTLLWDNPFVDDTEESHGTLSSTTLVEQISDPFIVGLQGQRLLVYFDNSVAIDVANVRAIGTTRHLTGGITPAANYTGLA